jgi:hypothetical protein
MGFTVAKDGTITYREWAPGASSANLIGEFSALIIQYSGLGKGEKADLTTDRWMESRIASYEEEPVWRI